MSDVVRRSKQGVSQGADADRGDAEPHAAEPRAGVWSGARPSAYERWELPHVGGAGREGSEESLAELARGPLTASQIEEIQQQAHEEAYAHGHAEGLARGLGDGRAQAREEIVPVLGALNEALQGLARPLADLDEEVEAALVTLATVVARQLLLDALEERPERVLAAVRAGVRALPSTERRVQLELHPEDLPIVREALVSEGGADWELTANPGLTRGGCRIESSASRIDATVEARLENVIAHVLGGSREPEWSEDVGNEEEPS